MKIPAIVNVLPAIMLLLALALSLVVESRDCDFHLSQNANGVPTRVTFGWTDYGKKCAYLRPQYTNVWEAFVLNGLDFITSDQTGASKTTSLYNMTKREICYMDDDIWWQLDGLEIDCQDGNVVVDKSNTKQVSVNKTTSGSYKITGSYEYAGDFAILIANGTSFGFSRIFYQHKTGVILIDNKCDQVKVVPLSALEPRLQTFLENGLGYEKKSKSGLSWSRRSKRGRRDRSHQGRCDDLPNEPVGNVK